MSKAKYLIAGLGLAGGGLTLYNQYKKNNQDLLTVDKVDLKRYAGKWYEIARIPHRYEKGCDCSTAEYTYQPDGYVEVVNKCLKEGREKKVTAIAFPEKGSNNSKLNIQYFWPLLSKYWIIALDDDYQFAMVGHPNRDSLWILSRYPEMDEKVYVEYLQIARQQGFDISRLVLTEQYCQ